MADSNASSLEAFAIRAGYGSRDVISAVSLSIASGEVLGLLGHNGAGKSTLLKTLAGVLPLRSGDIRLGGHSICRQSIAQRIALGVTYLPQGNPVFPHLSVNDNLRIRVSHRADIANPATVESVLESFPKLKDRLRQGAGSLSGGEKQMLSLAGALLSNPRFLLLDEPSLGLAPSTVTRTLDRLRDLARTSEVGILVVEQKAREALRVCDRLMVMKQGRVTYSGRCGEEMADTAEFRELCL